jgi:trehalose 6-phosphate phosphatase
MALPDDLAQAFDAFCRRQEVLIASDFDGVLAPFVTDPMAARAMEGTLEDLTTLAELPRTHTAVVSGRDLEVLTALTGLPRDSAVTRIGSHGAQSSRAGEGTDSLTADEHGLLERLTDDLHGIVDSHPGSRLELKPKATVLHTRGQEPTAADAAARSALEVAQRHTGVTVLQGKDVVEMSVVTADKGTALMALKAEVKADAVLYFGDDVTDEHAFEVMGDGDVSVKVGPGDSVARYRLDTPEDVAEALGTLLRLRSRAVG